MPPISKEEDFLSSDADKILLEKAKNNAKSVQQLYDILLPLKKDLPLMIKRLMIMSIIFGFISGAVAGYLVLIAVTGKCLCAH